MPFTLAHPAAVLWCARWNPAGVPFYAFVIGSMTPDFEYFLRLRVLSVYSHSAPGILGFCLPVGLLTCWIYRAAIATPLYQNLPRYMIERLPGATNEPRNRLRQLVLLSMAITFGAITHILWDGFTHGDGTFVLRWPGLKTEWLGLPLYKYLQHGSTLAGFAIMASWFHARPPRTSSVTARHDRWYRPLATLSFLITIGVLQQVRPGLPPANLVLQSINGLFVALLIPGCWFQLKTRFARN